MKRWIYSFLKARKTSTFDREFEFDFLEFELTAKLRFKNGSRYHIQGFSDEGDKDIYGKIWIDFVIDPIELPNKWSEIYFDLIDVLRHEMEHLTQSGWNEKQGKWLEDDSVKRNLINQGLLDAYLYLLLPKEIDANLQGLALKSRKKKEPLINTIKQYLDSEEINEDEQGFVIEVWRKHAIRIGGIPKF